MKGEPEISEASDGYSKDASSIGGGAPGQVMNIEDDDTASCYSQSLSSHSGTSVACTPDFLPVEPQYVDTTSHSQCLDHPETAPPETDPQPADTGLSSHSKTAPYETPVTEPQAVGKATKALNTALPSYNSGAVVNQPLLASLQRKARVESRHVSHLLAVRRLEEEMAGLKEGLGTGGLQLESIVDALTKVCAEHGKLAAEVTAQSTIGTGYSANSRENMMKEVRDGRVVWGLGHSYFI